MIVLPEQFYALMNNPWVMLVACLLLLALSIVLIVDAIHRSSWKQETFKELLSKSMAPVLAVRDAPEIYTVDLMPWKSSAFVYLHSNAREGKGASVSGLLVPTSLKVDPSEEAIASSVILKRESIEGSLMEHVTIGNGVEGYVFTSEVKRWHKAEKRNQKSQH